MLKFKRTVAVALALIMLCTPVFATEKQTERSVASDQRYSFSINIDVDKFTAYLVENLMTCPKRLDISQFGIPNTTKDAITLQEIIWYHEPLLFHIDGMGYTWSNGIIDYVYLTYHYDSEKYNDMYDECMVAANTMIADLRNNKAVDDVTKALLVHDRIIANCEYDYEAVSQNKASNESQEMYGALVNGVATCQGYSYAYMYLLRELGIKSYICSSDAMGHDWNIVVLNGKKYHVDVTFDDPVHDVTGRVYHDHFLLSTDALKQSEHNYDDFDSSPDDKKYDNYYWKNSRSEFQLIGNNLYYVDNFKDSVNCVGKSSALVSVSDVWSTSEGNYWKGNFARLSSDGKNLFYSLTDAIYLLDPSTLKTRSVYKPVLSGNAKEIYGFTYDDGYLVIDLFNKPNFDIDTKAKYQIRVAYDLAEPTASLTCSNEVAAYQTVNMKFWDDNLVSGYYWGKYEDMSKNTFTHISGTSAKEYVSESGTYYLTARDSAGNLSKTQAITFYATRLEANGGAVGIPKVITANDNSFTLPVPRREGYIFTGWSSSAATDGDIKVVTPVGNGTYYASWTVDADYDPSKEPEYVNKFTDVIKGSWYEDAVEYCAKRGFVNGVSETLFSPSSKLTREQFVMMIANMAGIDSAGYKYVYSGMTDVPVGKWYSGAIAWAVSEGYVKGVSADKFGLRRNITREQLARLFYVYAEDIGKNVQGRADLSQFADRTKISDWARENVEWAVHSGIISGMTKDTINPRGDATRAQTARMFMLFDKFD